MTRCLKVRNLDRKVFRLFNCFPHVLYLFLESDMNMRLRVNLLNASALYIITLLTGFERPEEVRGRGSFVQTNFYSQKKVLG